MTKLKKLIAITVAATMTLSLAGCASGGNNKSKVYKVGICQLVEHEALDQATKGFKEALTKKLGKDKVKFDEQNAQGETATCATIVNSFVSSNVDLILANATAPLQAASNATVDIPILGTSVTDYASALSLKNFKDTTGKNVSGTSDLAPIDEQANMLVELFPKAKKVGLLYCSAEPNSKFQVDLMKGYLKEKNIESKDFSFVDSNDIASVVNGAVKYSDVIYIPTDNTAASNTSVINNIAKEAKVPIIAGEEGICKGCGVATLSISYYDIGYKTGEMAYEVLVNKKDVSTMKIEYAASVTKKYNKKMTDLLKVDIPEGYKEIGE